MGVGYVCFVEGGFNGSDFLYGVRLGIFPFCCLFFNCYVLGAKDPLESTCSRHHL